VVQKQKPVTDTDASMANKKCQEELKTVQQQLADYQGQIEGISASQAVIQFNLDGTIITANDNFLNTLGYSLDEIEGQHHSMFVEPNYKASAEYQQFWEALNQGQAQVGEFKRIGKGGKEVWIQASYTSIKDLNGKPFKVVKYATDVTGQKLKNADYQGQIDGISTSQAVIQFNLDGTIITANDNFLNTLGYSLDEIKDQHHSMFVEPNYKASAEYQQFWEALNQGQAQVGEFKRFGKGGKEVWIQASYTPIKDLNGKPFKVVKYATDITRQKTEIKAAMDNANEKVSYLNDIPTPVMTIDRDFTINYMNPAGAGVAGLTPEDVIGTKCYDLFKTSHCHTDQCACNQAMTKDGIFTEQTIVDPSGLNIPIEYSGAPIKDTEGNITGALEFVVNITDTKKAMDDAQEKVTYLNEVPTPVLVVDRDMTIKFMNPASANAAGRTVDECIGEKCFSLFNTPHCNTEECRTARAMQQDSTFTSDTIASLPSGDLPIRYTGAPIKDAAGNIIGGLEYVINIAEENQAVADVETLVKATLAGQLDQRGDTEKYTIVGFKNVIKGINDTLDAIVQPVSESIEVMTQLSNNDLRSRVVGDYKGDLANMKNAVNTAIDSLTGLVGKIKESADALAESSDQLASAANQAGEATQQVASTSQDMATGAGDQASSAQQTASQMQQLTSVIEQVATGSQQQSEGVAKASAAINEVSQSTDQMAENAAAAADGSRAATEAAHSGADKAKQTVEGMEKITSTVDIAASKVTDLGQQSDEIGKIVAVIDDIAAQTNLLALNAAIEAALAGEHGRGFAVVSDEVRKLAERTASATKEIADLIGNIQKGVSEAVKAMEEGAREVQTGYQLATEAGESLEGILKASNDVSQQIEQISAGSQQVSASANELVTVIENVGSITEQNSAASQQMASTSEEVSNSVENIAGIAEENSAATEEVSASAEEMGAQVQEIVASSQSLREMSAELQEAVAVFKLN
jgi:methyl-accepting chemotaxis protein